MGEPERGVAHPNTRETSWRIVLSLELRVEWLALTPTDTLPCTDHPVLRPRSVGAKLDTQPNTKPLTTHPDRTVHAAWGSMLGVLKALGQ